MVQQVFIGNSNNLEDLKSLIVDKTNLIDSNIAGIYKILQTIISSGAWTGEAADTFFNNCQNAKEDFNNLVQFLNDYADLIGVVDSNLDSLGSRISSICRG